VTDYSKTWIFSLNDRDFFSNSPTFYNTIVFISLKLETNDFSYSIYLVSKSFLSFMSYY